MVVYLSMMASLRTEVLSIYRTILRTARTWKSLSGNQQETQEEAKYIREEARALFKKNKHLTDKEEIRLCIREAETRLELAHHYGIPYPRPVNLPPMGLGGPQRKGKKVQERLRHQAKPVYLHSHEEIEK
ncbi:PREDICTED: LYR motif-containing protein 1-like [Branchiostoma belcheri]|uniref:LYR motif-containing protein 1-like n=1 Tax=Branchiostoma belcheri TaxID=7741 RepID=A0A6P5AFX2_BRABE|nr:PREDICTED: LYR motif-containing protein 1-like [Branchiostoma belcheri]KAI8479175.1 LYR motif containing protein 1 [Branchiostoma belcheri]